KLHARGLKGLVYTVNTREQLSRVASRGYDGAFTNFPDLKP
ncbi:MAG: glycerophosphodiester phosphodiesterase, partial [Elusimicrobia bacterium]|nr:glycerophosphodiester phosphodiesterase [Elusimicrobiota bacterium]